MATGQGLQQSVVPAQPGFWVHLCDKGAVVGKQAVVAWLVNYQWSPPSYTGRTIPISTDGVLDDCDYFIENPDGSCIDSNGCSADSVEAAINDQAETWRLIEEDNAAEANRDPV